MTEETRLHDALIRWEDDGGALRAHPRHPRVCVACGSTVRVWLQGAAGEIGFCRECRDRSKQPNDDGELGGESG